eukprot:TRINITY_DN74307_c0_g1_i1.p1 TRINITY_DN74307_c0_g1~~TRINITY_DN74307_c0_g1_i1.p1  ORF type:complete len:322 (-),score=63.03 TRINITY_DN74307_c0_g1_i1:82-1008(-)
MSSVVEIMARRRAAADSRVRRRMHATAALLAGGAVLLLAVLAAPATFVSSAASALNRRSSRSTSVVPRQISQGGHGHDKMVIIRKKPSGFMPANQPTTEDFETHRPNFGAQEHKFFNLVKDGYNVSEVFFRVEGLTPWKRLGEIASVTGDYEEAIRSQWILMIEQSYYLSRKARFWMAKEDQVIQFGYTNETADIVPVTSGPLREGTPATELKGMLNRCGYMPVEKPRYWRHMHTVAKLKEPKKNDKWVFQKKEHLFKRDYQKRLEAFQRYNPDKYRGPYSRYGNFGKKRGIVVGCKPPPQPLRNGGR